MSTVQALALLLLVLLVPPGTISAESSTISSATDETTLASSSTTADTTSAPISTTIATTQPISTTESETPAPSATAGSTTEGTTSTPSSTSGSTTAGSTPETTTANETSTANTTPAPSSTVGPTATGSTPKPSTTSAPSSTIVPTTAGTTTESSTGGTTPAPSSTVGPTTAGSTPDPNTTPAPSSTIVPTTAGTTTESSTGGTTPAPSSTVEPTTAGSTPEPSTTAESSTPGTTPAPSTTSESTTAATTQAPSSTTESTSTSESTNATAQPTTTVTSTPQTNITTTAPATTTTQATTTTEQPGPKPCLPRNFGENSIVCVCSAAYCDTVPPVERLPQGEFEIYSSDQAGNRFKREHGHFQYGSAPPGSTVINVNVNTAYQTILGFGATFTDATAININSLNASAKNNLLRSYFSEDGIEYNIGRVPMGSTDFSTHAYTYDDGGADPQLTRFQLAREDYELKIPVIKDALGLSRQLALFASPWGAPAWMKTNGEIGGPGLLKSTMYQPWANYIIKFLQAYEREGLNFWAITTGNEPNTGRGFTDVPSVGWLAPQLAVWIANNLGPTLERSDYWATYVLTVDDQRRYFPDFIDLMFFSNPGARRYVDGFAVHWEDSDQTPVRVLTETRNRYPEKTILSTEARAESDRPGPGGVSLGDWDYAAEYVQNIIEDLNNWVTGWVDSNLALNVRGGPSFVRNNDVEAAVIVNAEEQEFYKQPIFYAQGHFSKFIPRGSERVALTLNNRDLDGVAFRRPDGGTTIVVHNRERREQQISITDGRRGRINIIAAARSVTTVLYW